MLRLLRSKLQIKLIFVFLVVVSIPLLLVSNQSLNLLSINLEEQLYQTLEGEIFLIQHMIEDYARGIGDRATLMAQLPSITETIVNKDLISLSQLLNIYQRNYDRGQSLINVLGVFDGEINLISLAGRAHDRTGFEWIPSLIEEVMDQKKTQTQVYPSHLGLIVIGVSPVIPRGEREAIGFTFSINSLDSWFFDSFKEISSSEITLLKKGDVLATTFLDEEGRRLGELPLQEDFMEEILQEPKMHTTVLPIGEDIFSLGLVLYGEIDDGTILIAGSSYLPILAAESAIKESIFLIGALSILGAILLALLFSFALTRPITKLAYLSNRIAEGDLPKSNLHVRAIDQVGQLTKNFNIMIDNLRFLIAQVKDSSYQVQHTTKNLSTMAQESRTSSEEISSRMEKTTAVVEEMAVAIEEVNGGIKRLNSSSSTSQERAQKGGSRVKLLEKKIEEIGGIVEESSRSITGLHKQMKEINKIIELIQEIMEQTNLLALNAAIEAARAGEYGLGFAVVADKIKDLADESTVAADQITEIINEIQRDTQNIVSSMEMEESKIKEIISVARKAREDLERMDGSVSETNQIAEEISAFTKEQTTGSREIAATIDRIAEISEEEAIKANTLAKATENLANLAKDLNTSIEGFRIEE